MINEAIVLAGGYGTRLKMLIPDLPKSMAGINGKPFLEYLLNYLSASGITRVVLSVGYLGESISDYFGDHHRNLELVYAVDEEPLGTGGGIRNAFRSIRGDESFVLNGDSIFLVNLEMMFLFHHENNAILSLALRYMEDTGRYGQVDLDALHRIRKFSEKGERSGPGYINGGVYLINKPFITGSLFPEKFSIEKDCFEQYCRDVTMLGFPTEGYFLDVGTPEDYTKAQDEFKKLGY